MADPLTLLEQIDAVIYQHEQLQQWGVPDSDGPIYPQQVERARLFGPRIERAVAEVEFDMVPDDFPVTPGAGWGPSGSFEPVTVLPPDTPSTTDHIGDEEWGRQQIEAMPALLVKATMTPEEIEAFQRRWAETSNGRPIVLPQMDVTIIPRRPRPWWRRIWRTR